MVFAKFEVSFDKESLDYAKQFIANGVPHIHLFRPGRKFLHNNNYEIKHEDRFELERIVREEMEEKE